MSAAIDHDVPIHRGGAEYDRANTHLMHRAHNRWKSTMTLTEARAKWFGVIPEKVPIVASPGW